MILHIVFSHGKESGPWGSKIKSMAEHAKKYGEVYSINYSDLVSPEERAERLINFLSKLNGNIVLVGSSMGGYVSTLASNNSNIVGLMLLAPAFYLTGYEQTKPSTQCTNVSVVHGWGDDIVPYQNSVKFAEQHKASLKLVDDGHRLSNSLDSLNNELEILLNQFQVT